MNFLIKIKYTLLVILSTIIWGYSFWGSSMISFYLGEIFIYLLMSLFILVLMFNRAPIKINANELIGDAFTYVFLLYSLPFSLYGLNNGDFPIQIITLGLLSLLVVQLVQIGLDKR